MFVGSPVRSTESSQYSTLLMHTEDLSINLKVANIQGQAQPFVKKIKDVHFAALSQFVANLFPIVS